MIPNVVITVKDGGLAQLPPSSANTQMKVGVCSDGIVGTIYSFSDIGTLQTTLGQGPLVESAAIAMAAAGGPILCLPINPSQAGVLGSVTHTGPGAGTVTAVASGAPRTSVALKIILGGAIGVFTFAYSINGGAYSTPILYAAPYLIPGTLTTVTFAAATYQINDVYTIGTDGLVTLVGGGPAASNVTHVSAPLDNYNVVVTITTAGALGAGQFQVSLDGGTNQSGTILIPSGGRYQPPNSGVVLLFAGTFTAGDTYSFSTSTAGFNGTDVTNACTVALGSVTPWAWLHLVGAASNAAGAATIAGVLDTQMTLAFLSYLFVFAILEVPIVEVDATIVTAFQNFVSIRVSACCGDEAVQSPLSGRVFRRNNAWAYAARLGAIIPSEDPGYVARGPLPNVVGVYPNFSATKWDPTTLDGGRFTTMRQFPGTPGFFVTNGNMMAGPGSDFNYVQRIRVMNEACAITRAAELPYLNGSFRVDPDTGHIDERDAAAFEGKVNAKLSAGLVPANASAATATVDRGANILSTATLPVTVSIVPLFTAKRINTQIGFSNPAAG